MKSTIIVVTGTSVSSGCLSETPTQSCFRRSIKQLGKKHGINIVFSKYDIFKYILTTHNANMTFTRSVSQFSDITTTSQKKPITFGIVAFETAILFDKLNKLRKSEGNSVKAKVLSETIFSTYITTRRILKVNLNPQFSSEYILCTVNHSKSKPNRPKQKSCFPISPGTSNSIAVISDNGCEDLYFDDYISSHPFAPYSSLKDTSISQSHYQCSKSEYSSTSTQSIDNVIDYSHDRGIDYSCDISVCTYIEDIESNDSEEIKYSDSQEMKYSDSEDKSNDSQEMKYSDSEDKSNYYHESNYFEKIVQNSIEETESEHNHFEKIDDNNVLIITSDPSSMRKESPSIALPCLPIPDLESTQVRLLSAIEPLLSGESTDNLRSGLKRWFAVNGNLLQQRLHNFALCENTAGHSWLSREWMYGYLRTRESLPLSTNVGFQLADEPGIPGLDRAARFIYRVASTHLQHLRGEIDREICPRGAPMCMRQCEVLNGGLRHPQRDMDEIRIFHVKAAEAEIGISYGGLMWVVRIADIHGQPHSVAWIEKILHRIVSDPITNTSIPSPLNDETNNKLPFTKKKLPFGAISWLPTDEAVDILDVLLSNQVNVETYDRLCRLIFTVELDGQVLSPSEHLRHLTFGFHNAWVRKPMSYVINLRDTFTGVHVEHSMVDGATVLAIVKRMQKVKILDTPVNESDVKVEIQEMSWSMRAELHERVRIGLDNVCQMAEPLSIHIERIPSIPAEKRSFRMSDDAIQQLIFTIAQLLAYGRVRSVYESVDIRGFQAGRTECLRPVTTEAIEFATTVIEGSATLKQLWAANEAHKNLIKTCKVGHGPERHLTGLQLMVDKTNETPTQFLDKELLESLSVDFLSTTSLGDSESIVRYAFAPTNKAGFGISYIKDEYKFESCLCYHSSTAEDPDVFIQALKKGAQLLWSVTETLEH